VQQADALHKSALAPATGRGDADLANYLTVVGKRVVAAAKAAAPKQAKNPVIDRMQFHLVKCDVPNAVSTGGGHLYVYTGLLAKCETEDDLAAALCLPVAHAIDLDLQSLVKPNPKAAPDRLVATLMDARFTPAQQDEALKRAAAIYAKGGWDPSRFARFLSSLGRQTAAAPTGPRKPPEADELSFVELRDRAAAVPSPDARTTEYLLALPNVFSASSAPQQDQARAAIRKRLIPPTNTVNPLDRAV
jgi:predicted Zn-dependent protease